jgi:hypothetical protein
VRDFFRYIIVTNHRFYPEIINVDKINSIFDEIDIKYAW